MTNAQGKAVTLKVKGYGLAGNGHSWDAAMRLPRDNLSGSLQGTLQTLGEN